jgi:DNA (cytosine-5)-methyltransferase 1
VNTEKRITLGSLFDGIGGFPYAGSFFGIEPLWAGEILPQAVSVTKRHFPEMEHAGDITALSGAELPPVDIITFGSPCQDLSTAGRRAGMSGARSGLFYEAIRIIDEMRRATDGKYPTYAVWENVPGAFSSGNPRGSDFRAVLEAFTKTEIPMPASGKWANAGMVRGNGPDIAWRVLDAQYFGVPQRRKRVFVVVDFGGKSAAEILFVDKGLRGNTAPCSLARQGTASAAQNRARIKEPRGVTAFAANQRDEVRDLGAHSGALQAAPGMKQQTFIAENCLNPWDSQQTRIFAESGASPTLAGADGGGGRNPGGLVLASAAEEHKAAAFLAGAAPSAGGIGYSEEVSPTLKAGACGFPSPCVCEPRTARTLTSRGDSSPCADRGQNVVAYGISSVNSGAMTSSNPKAGIYAANTSRALDTNGGSPCCNQGGIAVVEPQPAVTMRLREGCEGGGKGPLFQRELSGTLAAGNDQYLFSPGAMGVHQNQSGGVNVSETAYTLATNSNATGRNAPLVTHPEVSGTLCASGAGLSRPGAMASEPDLCVAYALQGNMIGRGEQNRPHNGGVNESLSYTLTAADTPAFLALPVSAQDKAAPNVTADGRHAAAAFNRVSNSAFKEESIIGTQTARQCKDETALVCEAGVSAVDCRNYKELNNMSGTLQAKNKPGWSLNFQNPVRDGYIVRRLTPTECERLQGFPDGWTRFGHDGKEISDSRRYQMLGNSVAIPCVKYILGNLSGSVRDKNAANTQEAA